jgi:predicted ATPase/DNA-binding XRE family transcriptional regulator
VNAGVRDDGELAPLLRWLRTSAGLTQEDLAERAGISARTVSDVERGLRTVIYRDTSRRIAAALSLDDTTRERFERAARARSGVTAAAVRGALPVPPTPLVGRVGEVADIAVRLADRRTRLLTLTGPGGVGKTRLAVAAAARAADGFPAGVRFVQLADTGDAALVPSLIARAVGVNPSREPVLDLVTGAVRDSPLLLVLDTVEHVLDAAPHVSALLAGCPRLVILATSRAPLRLEWEVVVPVTPLPLPASTELFVTRARAVGAALDVGVVEPAVADICARLDGLPLAIELAASRSRHFPPSAVLAQLDRRLPLLTGGPRDAPARQHAMRDTIDWSYQLLDPAARSLLSRLSVCHGFTLEAAEAIADQPDVLSGLSELIDHSLVQPATGPAEPPRFRMLDLIRDFAAERCAAGGDADLVRDRHVRYFSSLAERAQSVLRSSAQRRWHRRLEDELPNIRLAERWFAQRGHIEQALRLAGAFWMFWLRQGGFAEGRAWLRRALAMDTSGHAEGRARALWGAGWLAYHQGDYAETGALGLELVDLSRLNGRSLDERNGLTLQGMHAMAELRYTDALHALERCVALVPADEPWLLATSLLNAGAACGWAGNTGRAETLLRSAADRYAELGDGDYYARALRLLATCRLLADDPTGASKLYREAYALSVPSGDLLGIAEALDGLAVANAVDGDARTVGMLAAAAAAVRTRTGTRPHPFDAVVAERQLSAARSTSPAAWRAGWAEGSTMPLEDLLAVLSERDPAGTA